jgi:hypothetical protein
MRHYINASYPPKSVSADRVLCHDHVLRTPHMSSDMDGFRAWTDTKPPRSFVKCHCGWAGLPHYAHHSCVKATKAKPKGDQ